MAHWNDLTEEQKEIAKELIQDLGIPLHSVPNFDFDIQE